MLFASPLLFLGNPRTIIFIIFVLVLFFGAKRIPELFRGVGQGVREFKDASTNVEQPMNPNYQAPQPGYQQPNGYPPQPGYGTQPGYPPQNQAYNQPNGYPPQPQPQQFIPPAPGQVPPAPYPNPNNTPAS